MKTRLPLIALVLLSASTTCYAQSWRCTFSDIPNPLTFIELTNGSGKVVGNTGVSDVVVFKGENVVSFVEPVITGAVMVTTIFMPTGEAVHSRNTLTVLSADDEEPPFLVSQRMGKCRVAD